MKKRRTPGFTVRLSIIASVLLLAANMILGFILVSNSRAALKTVIDERMLDIANTAADMLDGDALKSFTKEDQESEPYLRIKSTLAIFQNNIDLEYIYCICQLPDGSFVFSVDPTVEDPGEFGQPIAYTDALYAASQGSPSVDQVPYADDWGKFYSAYSPVFDSAGEVAGIVAVDFDAAWYEGQIAKQTGTIIVTSVASVVIAFVLLFVATGWLRREMKTITADIADVAQDVDELSRAIDMDNVRRPSEQEDLDDVRGLGRRIHRVREGLRQYTQNLNSQANSMITALSSDYRSVYYIDLDKDEGVCYQPHTQIDKGLRQGERFPYSQTMRAYAEDYVTEKYRDAFLRFVHEESVRNALEKERIITFRYMINRDGQESYEMVRMAGVRHPEDRDDHIVHAIGMGFADVDAETRTTLMHSQALSDALAAAEVANRAKTAFLSNMSHEIRTPMNAIIGLDRIALNDPSVPYSAREYLEKIGASADHLLDIINDILDMSRIEAGRMVIRHEIFSLPALLEQINVMIGGQCRDKGLEWRWRLAGKADEYYIGDEMKLKQVLINILGNAVKFTPPGGSVDFSAERVSCFEGQAVFRFTVKDTGIGMTEDYLPKLFEPFSQEDATTKTKYGSTGLGMSITKGIVDMMNGEIRVESEKNAGTCFTVTVTFAESEQQIREEGSIDPKDMKVLIVDDDPVDCEYARMELEKLGISAEIALSGPEAVEMVKVKNARREAYDLILMDWKMPEMDGLETTRQIRRVVGEEAAIVILTSFHWEDMLEDAQEAGVDSFISKPLQASGVLQQFDQAFILKKRNAKNKAVLNGRRLLLAEDIDINAEIIEMILEMRELEVDRAENGRIAVEKFAAHPAGYYAAILMDMRMPEMHGLEATKAIRAMAREDAKTIPIIALTANAFDEDVQRSLQAGLNAHLTKPVDADDLFETLGSLIKA